ncbi:putative glycoprotein 3-alpha-L-fucosyltransferase A-like [Apostichopus japonicus]|uniref:Fucosyltransferase n=1 Tax=Stichopus japonicus TaxID=307972 RepID=A0A2G8K2V9_STIJA|nr:putative glycoprotein 3-alpha-L-fucosyltransferase A-like [Apostichopus japonicus]
MNQIKRIKKFLLTFFATTFMVTTLFYLPPTNEMYEYETGVSQGNVILSILRNGLFFRAAHESCQKRVVLFGIRQDWFSFCKHGAGARYRSLVKFPRMINCPLTECSVFLNHTKEPSEIKHYDAVVFTNVFHWLTPEMWNWVHGNRTRNQKWIMITQDSPLYITGLQPPQKYGNDTYDWSVTYKNDADFSHPYGFYERFDEGQVRDVNLKNFLNPKRGLLAWVASHCETLQWDRLKFVKDLDKLIPVETYGKCGDEQLPWDRETLLFDVIRKYKFYLSLENSCCDDYITEKFWRALKLGVVPVVVGAPLEHYIRKAPPNSFIHVDQFGSISELAIHLIELSGNDEKYLEYFKWRKEGKVVSVPQYEQYLRPIKDQTHCDIAERLMNSHSRSYVRKKKCIILGQLGPEVATIAEQRVG